MWFKNTVTKVLFDVENKDLIKRLVKDKDFEKIAEPIKKITKAEAAKAKAEETKKADEKTE